MYLKSYNMFCKSKNIQRHVWRYQLDKYKKSQFGDPWLPMPATIILKPLDIDENKQCEMYVQ